MDNQPQPGEERPLQQEEKQREENGAAFAAAQNGNSGVPDRPGELREAHSGDGRRGEEEAGPEGLRFGAGEAFGTLPEGKTPGEEAEGGEGPFRWLDLLYGVLFQPGGTFAALASGSGLRRGLIVFALVQLFNFYLQAVLTGKDLLLRSSYHMPFWLPPEQIAPLAAAGSAVVALLGMLVSFVGLFVGAGVYSLTAELLGGKGNGRGVLAGHSLAVLPVALGFPVRYAVHLFSLPVAVMSLVSFLLWIWVAVLKIIVLQKSCSLSAGRAAAAYFLPWLVLGAAVVAVIGGSLAILVPF